MSKKKDGGSTATGVITEAEDTVKKVKNEIERSAGAISGIITGLTQTLLGVISPFVKVQSAASDLAKSVGLAGKSIMSNSMLLIEQNKKMQLSRSYGISNEEMMKLQMSVMGGLQRNVKIDQVGTATPENPNFDSAMENLVAANQIFGADNVSKIVAGYDKLGMSMKTAAKATGKLYKEAGEYGINLQKYTENFTSNLQMAQTYNFRNGINGLKEMARKATEIRQDMRQIASFADKVGSVTGAVETAANLQVLGGSFASLANPLTMLNKSLTDVNGLQDMAISMTEGAATYNATTHQIEMDPVTRQIMKRAAESMGMDPAALIDQAYAQARRAEIDKQMSGIGNLSDEFRKMAPNIGEIDEFGRAGVTTANGEFKTFSDIATMSVEDQLKLQEELVAENRSESEDIKVIAKSVMGIEDIVAGIRGQTENELARNAVMPGVINGKSSLDLITETLLKTFDAETIAGAAKLDQQISNILANLNVFTGSTIIEGIKPFSANNPEEFGAKMGEAFNNVLGDIFGEDAARRFGETIGSSLYGFAKTMGEKLEGYGITFMKSFTSTEHEGREGSPALTPEDSAQNRNTVALAARDVAIEASNFNFNGRVAQQIEPVVGTELVRAATAVQGNNNQTLETVQPPTNRVGYDYASVLPMMTDAAQTRGVTLQAANFSLNGGLATQIQPVEGTEINPATPIAQGDQRQILEMIQTLANEPWYTVTTQTAPISGTDGQVEQAKNSVSIAARDVLLQAASFSLNGGENPQVQPLTEKGELNRATTAMRGDNNQVLGLIQELASGLDYSVMTPFASVVGNRQITPEITVSPTSVPNATVASVGNTTQTTLSSQKTEAGQNGNNGQHTINLTGTLTMNVNGDNGKIGTVDIMRMLENNPTFRQELAKALADTYAKLDKSGLVSN